jgi:hypothetical protein
MRRISALVIVGIVGLVVPVATSSMAHASTQAHFTSPSGNIDCYLDVTDSVSSADCLIESQSWKKLPKKPASCDLDWAPSELTLSSKKAGSKVTNTVFVGACRGDIGPLCEPDGCTVLAYGESVTVGTVTCKMASTGVTCVSTAGAKRGFTMSKKGYSIITK